MLPLLQLAVTSRSPPRIVSLLLENGADVNKVNAALGHHSAISYAETFLPKSADILNGILQEKNPADTGGKSRILIWKLLKVTKIS